MNDGTPGLPYEDLKAALEGSRSVDPNANVPKGVPMNTDVSININIGGAPPNEHLGATSPLRPTGGVDKNDEMMRSPTAPAKKGVTLGYASKASMAATRS